MTEYSNTRFTGSHKFSAGASAAPVAVPIKLMGDSSEYTMLEGEGLQVNWWRLSTNTNGDYEVYLSYDDDGTTQHVPLLEIAVDASAQAPWSSISGEIHITYPAPAGKIWKLWALAPNNANKVCAAFGGTITSKQ